MFTQLTCAPQQSAGTTINALPNEILAEIASHIPLVDYNKEYWGSEFPSQNPHAFPLQDVCRMRYASRTFATIGLEYFKQKLTKVYIHPSKKSLEHFRQICEHPVFKTTIEEIVVVGARMDESIWYEDMEEELAQYEQDEQNQPGDGRNQNDRTFYDSGGDWQPKYEALGRIGLIAALKQQRIITTSKSDLQCLIEGARSLPKLTKLSYSNRIEESGLNAQQPWYWRSFATYISEKGKWEHDSIPSGFQQASYVYEGWVRNWEGFDTFLYALFELGKRIETVQIGSIHDPAPYNLPDILKVDLQVANLALIYVKRITLFFSQDRNRQVQEVWEFDEDGFPVEGKSLGWNWNDLLSTAECCQFLEIWPYMPVNTLEDAGAVVRMWRPYNSTHKA